MASKRILIVEDDGIVALDIKNSLLSLGYGVCGMAVSSDEAISQVAEAQPDLVLMDIVLKGKGDGVQAAEQIRSLFDLPVVYLTAHSDEATLARAKITEPFGYVLKPYDDRDLRTTIEMALHKHGLEKRLKDSERWLAATLTSIGDAVIATDADGHIKFMNPVAEALTGWAQAQALGQPLTVVFNILNEETHQAVENPATRAIREGVVIGLANHSLLVARDGREFPVADSAAPIRDDKGQLTGVVLVFRDVTERQRAEEALRASEERYRRRSAELQALYDVSLQLNAQLEPAALLRSIVDQAVSLLGADAGCIYLYNRQFDALIASMATGDWSDLMGKTLRPGEGLSGKVFVTQRSLFIENYAAWPGHVAQYADDPRFTAMLAVPLLGGGGVLGVLNIGCGKSKPAFDEQDKWLAELFAAQAALALENARLHLEEYSRAMELAALNKASQTITSMLDREEMLRRVMHEVRELLRAEGASVLLYNQDTDELVFTAAVGPQAEGLVGKRMPALAGIAGWVMQQQCSVLVNDARTDPRFYAPIDAATGLTTRALVASPLLLRDQVIGVIEAINPQEVNAEGENAFSERSVEVLEVLAGSIVIAIENARLFASLNREKDRLELLYYLGRQLVETLDVQAVARQAIEATCAVVGGNHGLVYVLDAQSELMRLVAIYGYDEAAIKVLTQQQPLGVGEGLAGWVAAQRQSAVVPDVKKDEHWQVVPELQDPIRSALCVPLLTGDQVVGVLNIYSDHEDAFDEDICRLVESVASTVAVAIANARLFEAEQAQYRRLQLSQQQLIQAEKMGALGQLIAAVAHEINNPLQAIQNNLDLALEDLQTVPNQTDLNKYLRVALAEIERVASIVRRMRDFYRPARKEMRPADIHAVLESVLALSGKQLQNNKITIEREWASSLPLIQANPDYLKQVFLNLVLNAIDAMPLSKAGQVEGTDKRILSVRTALDRLSPPLVGKGAGQGERPAVRIEFADTGTGISPQDLPHIFEPFFTTKHQGSGLGLAISYGIIQSHSGDITVASQVGQGTTFTILLPLTLGQV